MSNADWNKALAEDGAVINLLREARKAGAIRIPVASFPNGKTTRRDV